MHVIFVTLELHNFIRQNNIGDIEFDKTDAAILQKMFYIVNKILMTTEMMIEMFELKKTLKPELI